MKKVFILFLLNGITFCGAAQIPLYSALAIPDSLKKDADVVTREEDIKFILKDINSARYEVHQVYTILNEKGKGYLWFQERSDKFQVLDDAEIKVYDASGMKRNTYTKKDMATRAYDPDLVPDGKVTYFNVTAPSYPITIEINYVIRHKGLFIYPGNYFQVPYNSVQHATFEVEAPAEFTFRYKILNCNYQPVITKEGNRVLYHWEVKNLTAFQLEKNSGSSDNYIPQVLLAPNKFQLDNYPGDMSSWKSFGAWMDNLYAKTTGLPDDRKIFYQGMLKNASTDREKAEILYNYLQNNMRYVSIQLGIGGLRPFPASFVDDKKYGDCKALSNYLKSALDAVGVKANVVIIQGSTTPRNVLEDFPADYFNHVILCIPQPKDTIWLECTSTTLPFAELGPFTENRKALMVTDNGGVLVNTPVSNYKDNSRSISTVIEVEADGGAKVNALYSLRGEGRNNLLMYFQDLKDDEKRKFFITQKEWKQPDIFDITTSPGKANPYLVTAKMEYEKIYSFNAGSKLFFEPRLYPVLDEELRKNINWKGNYNLTCLNNPLVLSVYKFRAGYTLETIPKNKTISKPFEE